MPLTRIKPTLHRRDSVPVDLGDGTCRTLSAFCFVEGLLWEQMDANIEQLTKVGDMLGRVNIALRLFGHPAAARSLVTRYECLAERL